MPYDPTAEQAAILAHDHRHHARVLAGPGTGKSATLVALVDHLLTGNHALRVKLLTFTRAATLLTTTNRSAVLSTNRTTGDEGDVLLRWIAIHSLWRAGFSIDAFGDTCSWDGGLDTAPGHRTTATQSSRNGFRHDPQEVTTHFINMTLRAALVN
jgi:hypothetical protein